MTPAIEHRSRTKELLGMFRRPGFVIFAGRAVSQGGFLAFILGPALVLPDSEYSDLVVSSVVSLLVVVAPTIAFQLFLIRLASIRTASRSALIRSLQLACIGALLGVALLLLLPIAADVWLLFMVGGGVLSVVPALASSLHAVDGNCGRSALVDAGSGVFFSIAAVGLVALSAPLVVWALGYALVWGLGCLISLVGPLSIRMTGSVTELGRIGPLLRRSSVLLTLGLVSMAFNRSDFLALSVVGTDTQAARYAVASRIVGPIMVAISSLNNSLYVRQLELRNSPAELKTITTKTAVVMATVALALVPLTLVTVRAIELVSDSFDSRDLLKPAILLALASVPYAFASPFGYALIARGLEARWLAILMLATIADLIAVLLLGGFGATIVSLLWVATQMGVLLLVLLVFRRSTRAVVADSTAVGPP